jgi:hypothetical protein
MARMLATFSPRRMDWRCHEKLDGREQARYAADIEILAGSTHCIRRTNRQACYQKCVR